MATRTINLGIGTYLSPDGHWRFGMHGDEVDVHEDDVERFDRLNGSTAVESVEPAPVVTKQKTPRKTPAKTAGK